MSDETSKAVEDAEPETSTGSPEIVQVRIDALSIAGLIRNQPRWPESDPRFRSFCEDVRKRGILQPLSVDEEDVVWDGFDRLRAAKAIGLKTVPAIRCKSVDGPDIAFGSLLHRKHCSKGQRVYSAYPYFVARHEAAQVRHRARLQSGGADIGEDGDDSVETLCQELGVSRELFYQASRLHDAFTTRPDLRSEFEPLIMDDEGPISLGQALSGIAGRLATKGKEKKETKGGKLALFKEGLKLAAQRFRHWANFENEEKMKACALVQGTVDTMPSDLLAEFRRAIKRTEQGRKAQASEGSDQ